MAFEAIKATRVVRTMLGLLERDTVLPNLVWRDAAGDFRGALDETISIKVPAYFESNKRTLRGSQTKSTSTLAQRKVDVTLTDNLYGVIPITSEELTLDVELFEEDIVAPVGSGLVRGLENELVTTMTGATYQNSLTLDETSPHETFFRARRNLNDARVPKQGRAVAVGSAVEEILLTSEQFIRADYAGDPNAFREAEIGRMAGFRFYQVDGLDPDEAYAFHQTAYVLNTRAPFVSTGTPWGETDSFNGFAVRVAQAVDPDTLVDNFHADIYTGTNVVKDVGSVTNGVFTPAEDPDDSGESELFVRAVKVARAESSSS